MSGEWIRDEYGYRLGDTLYVTSYYYAKQTADAFGKPVLVRSHYTDHVTDWVEAE